MALLLLLLRLAVWRQLFRCLHRARNKRVKWEGSLPRESIEFTLLLLLLLLLWWWWCCCCCGGGGGGGGGGLSRLTIYKVSKNIHIFELNV